MAEASDPSLSHPGTREADWLLEDSVTDGDNSQGLSLPSCPLKKLWYSCLRVSALARQLRPSSSLWRALHRRAEPEGGHSHRQLCKQHLSSLAVQSPSSMATLRGSHLPRGVGASSEDRKAEREKIGRRVGGGALVVLFQVLGLAGAA